VNSGQVVEASLGYFINPLVTVLLGVLVLRERLRPWQWAAVGIGAAAVAVLTADYGRPPLIALTLALSFGLYGLIKNRVGAGVGAVTGLTTETIVLALPAAIVLAWLEATGNGHFTQNPPWQGLLLASVGIATVVTLLFFAASARRVPLSTLGLLQYLTPTLPLLCGVLLLGEHMPPARWAGFALVWVALVVLTADTLRTASRRRVEARMPEPVGAVTGARTPRALSAVGAPPRAGRSPRPRRRGPGGRPTRGGLRYGRSPAPRRSRRAGRPRAAGARASRAAPGPRARGTPRPPTAAARTDRHGT
jgi:chloramphenicol-sensitive protein RarD